MQTGKTIGEAARYSGVKVPTIRYYEEIGLLQPLDRTEGNRRLYGPSEIQRLKFIKHARELGFDIDAIRTLTHLQDTPDQPCDSADQIAESHLQDVRRRIASLKMLEAELQKMLDDGTHGRVRTCSVIETLADHGNCTFHPSGAADQRPLGEK